MIEVASCPICQSSDWGNVFQVKDHSITQEVFHVKHCKGCSFLITSPRPENRDLDRYYQSDNYISHSGKSSGFINSVYLIARNYSLKWKLKLVNQLQSKGNALDMGCGTGEFLHVLKNDGWIISGIEPNNQAREKAQKLLEKSVHKSMEEVHVSFDLITLWHVLEHLPNLNDALEKIFQSLTQGGTLLIAVPNHKSVDAKKYSEFWAGFDVPRHLWHFSKDTMVLLLQKHGFKLKKTIPMKLDAYYVSMLSEKYKGNGSSISNSVKGFLSGLFSNLSARKTGEYSSLIYIAKK